VFCSIILYIRIIQNFLHCFSLDKKILFQLDTFYLYPTCVFFYNIVSVVVVVYNHDLIKVIVVVVVASDVELNKNPLSLQLYKSYFRFFINRYVLYYPALICIPPKLCPVLFCYWPFCNCTFKLDLDSFVCTVFSRHLFSLYLS